MKKQIKMLLKANKIGFCAIAAAFVLFFVVGIKPISAESSGSSNNGPCTRVGTWHGVSQTMYGDLTYMAVYTPGKDATRGQVTMRFNVSDPTLFGIFPDAVKATNNIGVWKKGSRDTYQFTWIACASDADGDVVYKSRVSGQGEMLDCNNVEYTYTLEIWIGDVDIYEEDPPEGTYYCFPGGTAFETRMPLVQTECSGPE